MKLNAPTKPASTFLANEQGIAILMFAILLVPFLTVAGLAIDAGNLYRARVRIQKAADAGVFAALNYRTRVGFAYANSNQSEVEDRAVEVALANLRNDGFKNVTRANSVEDVDYDPTQDLVTIELELDIPLLLLDSLPLNIANFISIPRVASGQLSPANVMLVLDISGSMACESAEPTCSCRTTNTCGDGGARVKIEDLQDAIIGADAFLDQFNPNRDKIGIVLFNTGAQVAISLSGQANFSSVEANIRNVVQGLTPSGNTNICEGLEFAYNDVAAVSNPSPLLNEEEIFYVLFTDGAPTAARFNFPSGGAYSSYIVHYAQSDGTIFTGLSPFIDGSVNLFNHTDPTPPTGATLCGTAIDEPTDNIQSSLAACAGQNSLGFILPTDPGTTHAASVTFDSVDSVRQQYYHCAIELADDIRADRGTVFAIGLGQNAAMAGDPYQGLSTSDFVRRDYFLTRLSFDMSGPTNHNDFNYTSYNDYDAIPNPRARQGGYLTTTDPAEMKTVFVRAARNILFRLVE